MINSHALYRLSYGGIYKSWHFPIFPGRHQPSIFGTIELNFRVRDGNGCTLNVINTNYLQRINFSICSFVIKYSFNFFEHIKML